MNPIRKLRQWIIGDALAAADDVFEKSRLELTFNYTLFFLCLGLFFYFNIFAQGLWWQFYITTLGVILLPMVLVVLKKTGNVTTAGYVYMGTQMTLSLANQWLIKFEINFMGGLWCLLFLFFAFFVMGKKWGFFVAGYLVVSILVPTIDKLLDHRLLNYHIPPEQLPEQLPVFVLIPFSMLVFAFYQVVRTRHAAEKQIRDQQQQLRIYNDELEEQKKDILASINYARRIQYSILPARQTIDKAVPSCFILYKPKDIVSGDFYWFHEINTDEYIIICADCTGHGVPGAFMTVIGSNLLNQIIIDNKIHAPAKILSILDQRISLTLKQETQHEFSIRDGMDLSLLKVNKRTHELIFTSAKRPAVFIRNGELRELKGSKNSLGGLREGNKDFEEVKITYSPNDILYFFTDGYTDQFGGDKAKKFSFKRLRDVLASIWDKPVNEQKSHLDHTIESWRANHEQVDDILIMGIRFQ